MKFIWCDTETTGLEPNNAAPFQVAFIYVQVEKGVVIHEQEIVYYLNPFDINGIEFSEEAAKVHGYTRQQIEAFDKSSDVVMLMDNFLSESVHLPEEKMYFVGYNGQFDYKHLCSLFNHHGYKFEQYFYPKLLDVFDQVKKAGQLKVLPYLENRKLTTIAKYLGINLDNAHDALGDIRATREVAKSLVKKGINL